MTKERTEAARAVRWKGTTPEQRSEHGRKMALASAVARLRRHHAELTDEQVSALRDLFAPVTP